MEFDFALMMEDFHPYETTIFLFFILFVFI